MHTVKRALVGLGIAAVGLAGLAAYAAPADAATNATAITSFTGFPDVGNHGTWADDSFTRSATVSLLGPAETLSDCGSSATTCYQYSGTINDSGTFTAISGAKSPQAGVTISGTPSGTFQATANISFYSSSDSASASGVPASVSGAGSVSTTDWVEQFFAKGTTFGTGPVENTYSKAYSAPATCENWVDGNYNSGGSLASDGDITGVSHCLSYTGAVSSFADYSASCLDNSNYSWTDGNPLQLWTCGAAGGEDQAFRLAKWNGAEVLESVAPSQKSDYPWCVTAPSGTGRLTISSCTGTGDQVIAKQGPYYVFTADGYVMDDSGFHTSNGSAVIAYPKNDGRNQRWSLP
jgi:hypothetical protein